MEKNVKLNFHSKKNVTKKIGDQSFKIKPFISIAEKEYILEKIAESINERLDREEDIVPLIAGIQGDLDMLICFICTDVNLDGIDYKDIYNSEFIPMVKSCIINYDDIEKSCNSLMTILKFAHLIPDLSILKDNFNLEDLAKNRTPEEIEGIINVIKDINIPKEG